jgi:uncharacterized tellurite resistance protein B-like protein
MTVKQWYDSIGKRDSIFDVKDPEKFKEATASILCNILHLDSAQEKEELQDFCTFVKNDAKISEEKLSASSQDALKSNIETHTKVIKEQLDNDKVKMMEFMRMLNRFIMVDKCKEEDYCIFDKVKELLFDK